MSELDQLDVSYVILPKKPVSEMASLLNSKAPTKNTRHHFSSEKFFKNLLGHNNVSLHSV